jgi:superfamily II DNA helicase RecQ
LKAQKAGKVQHIITTIKQLFKTAEGHLLHLAVLLHNPNFQKRIKSINIDEAHFIHTAGLACYGDCAFRPAWGKLDELKALLPCSVPWQAMSATFPPHILKTVEAKILCPMYITIRISLN